MYKETNRDGTPPRSKKEIAERLDQIAEMLAKFGKGSKIGINLLFERADLQTELEGMEEAEKNRSESSTSERPMTQPAMAPREKKQREQVENANQILAETTASLLSGKFSQPELGQVLERLRDPKKVEGFLGDKVGTEFFLQGVRGLKAKQIAERALRQFYEKATGRSYREEAA